MAVMQERELIPNALNKVLIVEDSHDLQMALTTILERIGCVPLSAYNGKEALSLLANMIELPSLIILDLMMPVMDGFEFREVQQNHLILRKIPIVLMTADSNPFEKAKKMGISKVLSKPISMEDLIQVISECGLPASC